MDPDPEIYFEIHSLNDLAYGAFLGEALGAMLSEKLPEMLGGALGALEIPAIDLTEVAGTPTIWHLTGAEIDHADGYLTLSGSIGL